jgi:Phage tail lysozyme
VDSLMASDFAKRAFAYYIGQQLPPHQAAALAGNADWESGGNPTVPGDAGKSWGIFQWDKGRKAGLYDFAADPKKNGTGEALDPTKETTQLAYALYELKTSEKPHGDKFFASGNIGEANDALMGYLRPLGSNISPQASHGYTGRYNNAADLMAMPNMATALAMPPPKQIGEAPDWQQAATPGLPSPELATSFTPAFPPAGLLDPRRNPHATQIQTGLGLLAANSPQYAAMQQLGLLSPFPTAPPQDPINLPGPGRRGLLG